MKTKKRHINKISNDKFKRRAKPQYAHFPAKTCSLVKNISLIFAITLIATLAVFVSLAICNATNSQANAQSANEIVDVYFENTNNWSEIYCCPCNDQGEPLGEYTLTTKVGPYVYKSTFDTSSYDYYMFTDGTSSNKTSPARFDIYFKIVGPYSFVESQYEVPGEYQQPLFFDNSKAQWSSVSIYETGHYETAMPMTQYAADVFICDLANIMWREENHIATFYNEGKSIPNVQVSDLPFVETMFVPGRDEVASVSINFDKQGHGTSLTYKDIEGCYIENPGDPTEPGYIFKGWYKEPACTTLWDFANDAAYTDTTLYAKWEEASSTDVTLELNGGGICNTSIVCFYGQDYSVGGNRPVIPTYAGHTFAGFYDDAGTQYFDADGKATKEKWDKTEAECTLYARYTEGQTHARNIPLTIRNSDKSCDGGEENWYWDAENGTLYLNGADINNAVLIADIENDVNICLGEDTTNNIKCSQAPDYGALTIAWAESASTYSISFNGAGTLNITSPTGGFLSVGKYGQSNTVDIADCKINIDAQNCAFACALAQWDVNVDESKVAGAYVEPSSTTVNADSADDDEITMQAAKYVYMAQEEAGMFVLADNPEQYVNKLLINDLKEKPQPQPQPVVPDVNAETQNYSALASSSSATGDMWGNLLGVCALVAMLSGCYIMQKNLDNKMINKI